MKWYLKVMKQYADFNGRARRKEYWMFTLFNMIIMYGLLIFGAVMGNAIDAPQLMFIGLVYALATILPSIAVAVRRMHDLGKSGWYALIPYYNIYLTCLNGEQVENQYGSDPKAMEYQTLQKV